MNSVREFASWRPDVDPLDDATADRIWAELAGEHHAPSTAAPTPPAARRERRKPHRPHHRWPAVAAATVVAVGVGGLVAIERRGEPEAPTVPAPVTDTSGDREPDVDAAAAWAAFPSPSIGARDERVVVATPFGDQTGLFVWGGCCADDDGTPAVDGAYYDGESWRAVPDAPLTPARGGPAAAAWTGSDVLVVSGTDPVQAARFDPATFAWRAATPPIDRRAGNELTQLLPLEDGRLAFVADATLSVYDASADTWDDPTRTGGQPTALAGEVVGIAAADRVVGIVANERFQSCGPVRFEAVDVTDGTRRTHTVRIDDFVATAVAPLPDGRFVVLGHQCSVPRDVAAARAIAITPDGEETVLAAPPAVVDRSAHPTTVVDHWVVVLSRTHDALMSYDWTTDTWSVGPSPGLVDEQSFLHDNPIVPYDGGIVLVTPVTGTFDDGGEPTCCTVDPESYRGVIPAAIVTRGALPTTTVRVPITAVESDE